MQSKLYIAVFIICYITHPLFLFFKPYSEQYDFASKIVNYFENRDLSDLNLSAGPSFQPLSASVSENQVVCAQIYATVMSAFRKDAKMPVKSSFLDYIIEKALESNNQAQVVSLSRIISSLVNKQGNQAAW